jgi:excisionase family DNA binding protein
MSAKMHRLGLTTSEAARHLGVSMSTIRRWSDMGYVSSYRTPGGQRRFSVEQLDAFIDSLQTGGAPPRPEPVEPDETVYSPPPAFRAEPPGTTRFGKRAADDDDDDAIEPPPAA